MKNPIIATCLILAIAAFVMATVSAWSGDYGVPEDSIATADLGKVIEALAKLTAVLNDASRTVVFVVASFIFLGVAAYVAKT